MVRMPKMLYSIEILHEAWCVFGRYESRDFAVKRMKEVLGIADINIRLVDEDGKVVWPAETDWREDGF